VSGAPAELGRLLSSVPPAERDPWVDLVLDFRELPDDEALPHGCVPYLPCPVAALRTALELASVSSDDVFVDVGAGVGRTLMLAHLLTGAGCVGIEVQPRLARTARAHAAWLRLPRVQVIHGDARRYLRFLTTGTVFFLYCPFGGERLRHALHDLRRHARTRTIHVCCVDLPLDEPWLHSVGAEGRVEVYRSGV